MQSGLLWVVVPPGRAWRPIYLRGSMHAGPNSRTRHTGPIVGVVVLALLILLAIVVILALG